MIAMGQSPRVAAVNKHLNAIRASGAEELPPIRAYEGRKVRLRLMHAGNHQHVLRPLEFPPYIK